MNIFELKIWDNEGQQCTFYTVQNCDDTENETDKFLSTYENHSIYREELQELLSFVIYAIGDDHGAIDELFNRHENEVTGLPPHGMTHLGEFTYHYPNFPLRLYALKITEEIVILFNGGIKDGSQNQTSSLELKWIEACQYAKRITEAMRVGEIVVDFENRIITNDQGEEDILL